MIHVPRESPRSVVRQPRIVEAAFTDLLSEPVDSGRTPLVVFTSGGNGAGSSTSIAADDPAHIDFDSTLSQSGCRHYSRSVSATDSNRRVLTRTNDGVVGVGERPRPYAGQRGLSGLIPRGAATSPRDSSAG